MEAADQVRARCGSRCGSPMDPSELCHAVATLLVAALHDVRLRGGLALKTCDAQWSRCWARPAFMRCRLTCSQCLNCDASWLNWVALPALPALPALCGP